MEYGQTTNQPAGQQQVPNDIAILVLGIISIALCGVGIITGIIALSMSGRARKAYNEAPHLYSQSSYNQMNAGRICAIIGVSLSGLAIVFYIFYIVVFVTIIGASAGSAIFDGVHH